MSSGFNIIDNTKPLHVKFVAAGDSEMEDEGLNPPLVRERWVDQSNVFLDVDYTNQVNPDANTSQWIIGNTINSAKGTGGFFANRINKFCPAYILASLYAPNINSKNNILEFEVNGRQWRATIPINNYTRLTTDYCNVPITVPATYTVSAPTWAPLPTEVRGDPNDGIIDHILTAMNTAVEIGTGALYDPLAPGLGQFYADFSNGYFSPSGAFNSIRYRNQNTGENLLSGDGKYGVIRCRTAALLPVAFRMTGGNTFQKGLHAWGCSTLPNPVPPTLYTGYIFGPVQLQYTRWFDIIMPELTQFSKLKQAGSGVSASLLARIYTSRNQPVGLFDVLLDSYRQPQINMRKDYTLSYLNLEIRDEYGELYEIPKGVAGTTLFAPNKTSWPNTQGLNMSLVCQL